MKDLKVISWRVINVDPIGRAKNNSDILLNPNDYKYLYNFIEVWENKFKIFRTDDRLKCDKCSKCYKWKYCLGDSFHTFNFDERVPNFCIKNIYTDNSNE